MMTRIRSRFSVLVPALAMAVGIAIAGCQGSGGTEPRGGPRADAGAGPSATPQPPARAYSVDAREVGLFIGINEYPYLPRDRQLDGCVNDARDMEGLFSDRFGFDDTQLLVDAAATREGIKRAFAHLVRHVERRDGDATVVIGYSGHGSRVRDSDTSASGLDEPDLYDETWVPFDGAMEGRRDILDDDVHELIGHLTGLGAEVVLFSDSCHSASVHRGVSPQFKTRRLDRTAASSGPDARLLTGVIPRSRGGDEHGSHDPEATMDAPPRPGFVSYTASADASFAYEHQDDQGRPCGRFTYAIRQVNDDIDGRTTFEDVHRLIVDQFEVLAFHDQQPQFHASLSKRVERFLGGGMAPAHARIVSGSRDGDVLEVTMGSFDGVAEGAVFDFYSTLSDLEERSSSLGQGEVIKADEFSCRVRLERDAWLPDAAVARLDAARMKDVVVGLGPRVSGDRALRAALRDLAKDNKLSIAAEDGRPPTVVLAENPHSGELGLYAPTAQPRGDQDADLQPSPVIAFLDADAGQMDRLRKSLLRYAQVQRLMSLETNGSLLGARLVRHDGAPLLNEAITRFEEGEQFAMEISNRSSSPFYITVLTADPLSVQPLQMLFPQRGEEARLEPGATMVIGEAYPFRAQITRWEEQTVEKQGYVRTPVKVIATSEPRAFDHLLQPPREDLRGRDLTAKRKGPPRPFEAMLASVLHGGEEVEQLTRSMSRTRGMTWATATLVFDVAPRAE